LDERFTALEKRIDRLERKVDARGPKAATWGGIGSVIGSVIVVVLGYLGVRPPGQGQ
jgi:tetrahydromethanopterin S-methyltransferase subunit G